MADLSDAEIDVALERGRAARLIEPRVADVSYDRSIGRMKLELTNGCTFQFPPRSLQGLENASDEEIAAVEILGRGTGLHWAINDSDFTVAGLLAGRFGTRSFMESRLREALERDRDAPSRRAG